MKLSLERSLDGQRGHNNFMRALVESLQRDHSVTLVGRKDKSDIHLSVVAGHKDGSKNILRLDGVYYDVGRLSKNTSIAKSLSQSDGVVFQSEWSKKFVTGMLRIAPRQSVSIWNGVNQSVIRSASPVPIGKYEKWWVSCAHWRVNKRAEAIADAFLLARKQVPFSVGFCFIGGMQSPDFMRKNKTLLYLGEVPHDRLFSILKSTSWMCHICHVDSCPNSVIEGLSAGLPVLSNNIGGTPEIVGASGTIVPVDRPFSFKPIASMQDVGSSSVDVSLLAQSMVQMMNGRWSINRPDLDISVTARRYYEFFQKILRT